MRNHQLLVLVYKDMSKQTWVLHPASNCLSCLIICTLSEFLSFCAHYVLIVSKIFSTWVLVGCFFPPFLLFGWRVPLQCLVKGIYPALDFTKSKHIKLFLRKVALDITKPHLYKIPLESTRYQGWSRIGLWVLKCHSSKVLSVLDLWDLLAFPHPFRTDWHKFSTMKFLSSSSDVMILESFSQLSVWNTLRFSLNLSQVPPGEYRLSAIPAKLENAPELLFSPSHIDVSVRSPLLDIKFYQVFGLC